MKPLTRTPRRAPAPSSRNEPPPYDARLLLSVHALAALLVLLGTVACESGIADPTMEENKNKKDQIQTSATSSTSRIIVSRTRRGEPLTNEISIAQQAGFECKRLNTYGPGTPLVMFACVRGQNGAETRLLVGALQFGDLDERVSRARGEGWDCHIIAAFDKTKNRKEQNVSVTIPHQAYVCTSQNQ